MIVLLIILVQTKLLMNNKKFKGIINAGDVSLKNIQKLYRFIKHKLIDSLHKYWEKNKLGKEPSDGGVSRI